MNTRNAIGLTGVSAMVILVIVLLPGNRLLTEEVLLERGRNGDLEVIKRCLQDPRAVQRTQAVRALARLSPNSPSSLLLAAASDQAIQVRLALANSVALIESEDAVRVLDALLDDSELTVRREAARAACLRLQLPFGEEAFEFDSLPETVEKCRAAIQNEQRDPASAGVLDSPGF